MDIRLFIEKMKLLEEQFLNFIENECEETEFITEIEKSNIKSNPYELEEILHMISKIANHHFRNQLFLQKIYQVLLFLKEDIQKNFSNFEIFQLFKNNKPILLFLLKQQIIIPDEKIAHFLTIDKYYRRNYPIYFFNEFQDFFPPKIQTKIKNKLNPYIENDPELFEQNRMNGENESYVCSLIRNDNIDDFIIYLNKNNMFLNNSIVQSIFESNSLLLKKECTLIEYAAFFGSIQIFNFLKINNVPMDSNLWFYAIHGKNAEIIHLLEDDHIATPNASYRPLLIESMKCHHSDIVSYFKDNFMKYSIDQDNKYLYKVIQNYSFYFLPEDMEIEEILSQRYEIIKYGHINLVDLLIKELKFDINCIIILTKKIFL